MTVEQLAILKKISDSFEAGYANKAQLEELKSLLTQLNHKQNKEVVVVEANGELTFK